MTREEIVRLARDAGFAPYDMSVGFSCNLSDIERFAALVADAERARTVLAAFEVSERQIAAEREACAVLVETLLGENPDLSEVYIAAEIRARGEE